MPGQHLSRWTLAWFGSALLFLLASCGLVLLGAGGPQDWSRGAGLALVHLLTLGWLSQVMLGALIQFVPVLAARPLALPGLALPALIAMSLGTATLAAGFLYFDGHDAMRPLFLIAPVIIGLGFTFVALMIGATLLDKSCLHLPGVRFVILAVIGLAGLWTSGAAMVLTLTGSAVLRDLTEALPLHILLGIGGWLSVAAFGVSYKLFSMFLLTAETGGALRKASFVMAGAAVGVLLAGLVLTLAGSATGTVLAIGIALLALTAPCYLAEITRLWRSRRRPVPETNMLWSRAALAALGLSAALAVPGWFLGGTWAEAAIFVALIGWLSVLTLAQMVKIVSFLTWIQIFAPLIGRRPVPMVDKLTDAHAVGTALTLWVSGTVIGGLALLLTSTAGFRVAAALLCLGAVGIIRELISIRHLAHLTPSDRPAILPPLILPLPATSN